MKCKTESDSVACMYSRLDKCTLLKFKMNNNPYKEYPREFLLPLRIVLGVGRGGGGVSMY